MSYRVLSIQEKQAYYDEWISSGETQPHFLKRKNLSLHIFKTDGLKKRSKHTTHQQPLQPLLPVQIKATQANIETMNLWAQFPSGTQLHFVSGTSVDYLSSLIVSIDARSSC